MSHMMITDHLIDFNHKFIKKNKKIQSDGYALSPISLKNWYFLNTPEKRKKAPIWEGLFVPLVHRQ